MNVVNHPVQNKGDHAWGHMLNTHLDALPRAYALSAKQKTAYQQRQSDHWAALLRGAIRQAWSTAWARWVAPARCDGLSLSKRHQYRISLGA